MTPSSVIESLGDLERLMALMKSFGVAIVELPGGIKVVLAPEQGVPTAVQRGDAHPDLPGPRELHDDPAMYADGEVPRFVRQ